MNKKTLSYLSLLIALFAGALYYTETIQSPMLTLLNSIKISYHTTVQNIEEKINRHFFQAKKIKELEKRVQEYQNDHILVQQLASEINILYKENNSSFAINPKTELVRTISYQKFGNLNRIWIDIPDYNSSKIYGLIFQDFVAGIVIPKNNKPLALLNSDIKSTYAVYIGKNMAPGIVHGNNDKNLVVNFIPAWFDIKAGDEVVTSGLDNIFFKGLKVGKVIAVSKSQGYQNAIIEQYYKSNEPLYFHIIRSLR